MATIDSKELVDKLIANNGMYPGDDLAVVKIVRYNNAFNGGIAYGLIYEGEDLDRYHASQFINNPETVFERK